MKRILSFILVFVLVAGLFPLRASADSEYSLLIEECYNFISNGLGQYALSDLYYCYDNFVDQINTSEEFAFWQMYASLTSDLSFDPSMEDYAETLSNVIALQDIQNASDPSAQQSLDNLKDSADVASDARQLLMDGLTLYTDIHGSEFEKEITEIANNCVDAAQFSDEYLQGLGNLYNQFSTFAQYDNYLAEIEKNSSGKLQLAAMEMRNGLLTLMDYNVNAILEAGDYKLLDVDKTLFGNLDELTDKWDEEAKPVSILNTLKNSYKLGADGMLLMGNFILGTENIAKRIRELRALREISDVTKESIFQLEEKFFTAYENGTATEEMANHIVEMFDHLYDTHRRGEYCLYSILKSDSRLLSLLSNTDDIESWYQKLTAFMSEKEWYLKMTVVGPEVLETHHYSVFGDGIASTWEEAAAYCESLGGHLATIGSQSENDIVYSIVRASGYESAYFGLTDAGSEGTWRTANGEPVIFFNWGGSEPNNERSKEHYAMFYYKFADGSWNDGDFGKGTVGGGTAFICEWDVDPNLVDINTLLPQSE